MMELILGPWAWYVVGPLITVLMVTMFYFGKTFGVSSNFRTICAIGGAGKYSEFFRFDWKSQVWNLVFIFGTAIGGFIGKYYLSNYNTIEIAEGTKASLMTFGISNEEQGKKLNGGLSYWKESFGAHILTQDFYEVQTKNYTKLEQVIL